MKKFLLDCFGAFVFMLVSIWGLSQIDFNSDFINPISKTFGDFEMTDMVFSKMKQNANVDTNVVLVNFGELNREGTADLIDTLNKYSPLAIGIDARYIKAKKDSVYRPEGKLPIDTVLARAFSRAKNLVLVSKLENPDSTGLFDTLVTAHPMFHKYSTSGFANLITEGEDKFKTSRVFAPIKSYRIKKTVVKDGKETLVVKDTTELAFAVKLAQFKNPAAVKKLLARGRETETINYTGNFITAGETTENNKMRYFALDVGDVFNPDMPPADKAAMLKDKIVIVGYMGPSFDKVTWEDKFFTPLNPNYVGKTYPDMYGMVIHANIVSMVLEENFIDDMPDFPNTVIALILVFLNIMLFSWLYQKFELYFDGLSLVVTLLQAMGLTLILLFVFLNYNLKIDFTLAIVALFLTGNLIEIYYGIVKILVLKFLKYLIYLTKKPKTSGV